MPFIIISELYFEDNSWVIELQYHSSNQSSYQVDSIFVFSSFGSSKLLRCSFSETNGLLVFRNDSLTTNLEINPNGDSISIISYFSEYSHEDYLIYGDYAGAIISKPRPGQSLCRMWYNFSKDNSPSIGEINDTTGVCGTLKGIVYNLNNFPVLDNSFRLLFPFETNSSGEYSTRVFSSIDKIKNLSQLTENNSYSLNMDEINYVMEPDSVVYRDIHLKQLLHSGIFENNQNSLFKLFPNPIKRGNNLQYETDLPILSAQCNIKLFDIKGNIISSCKISDKKGIIYIPDELNNGIYIVSVWMNNKLYTNNRIIISE